MADITVENPATGEVLGAVPDTTPAQVDAAVQQAYDAFAQGVWRSRPASEREKVLWKIAEWIERDKEDFALLSTLEAGKPIRDSRSGDVEGAIDAFRFFAGSCRRLGGQTVPVDGPYVNHTVPEPLGVVAAIVPWNYPLCLAAWKVAPALAAGCSVILKPSELTPFGALKLEETIRAAGLPPGVFRVLTGYGATTGDALSRHERVAKVAFTGSRATARRILIAAAESNLKPVSLELGGKSANLVFADANIPAAVRGALWGAFLNQGQVCTAGSRLLVEEPIYEEFLALLVDRAHRLRLGDPRDPNVDLGPLVSAKQKEKVLGFVQEAKAAGYACPLPGDAALPELGHFVAPVIFSHVPAEARLAQEEIFGPVLSVLPFRTEEEAIRLANATRYGLAAGLWTENLRRAQRVSSALAAGVVWTNCYNHFDVASPFGGLKESGHGRDLGEDALREYTAVRSLWSAR
ncbi:MAG: aldehyde dehydrogenase family protein [Bryobacter sp.]|nr:aldehyde dehydrogenase family protein [Bryobacter sp.]